MKQKKTSVAITLFVPIHCDLWKYLNRRYGAGIYGPSYPIYGKGQVMVSVDCATNPKQDGGTKSWEVHFEGLWDIAQGHFVKQKFKRTFSGMYPPQQ